MKLTRGNVCIIEISCIEFHENMSKDSDVADSCRSLGKLDFEMDKRKWNLLARSKNHFPRFFKISAWTEEYT
jgi:hypothetical protein